MLLVVFLVALFLRQPKIANGTIRLISQNQPYELLSPQNGKLILLHKLDEHINKMSEIAYIHNSVEYGIVQMLQNTIISHDYNRIYMLLTDTAIISKVGSLNANISNVVSCIYKFQNYDILNMVNDKIEILTTNDSILSMQLLSQNNICNIEKLMYDNMLTTLSDDSLLYKKNSITYAQLEQTIKNTFQQQQKMCEAEKNLISIKHEKKRNLLELQNFVKEIEVKKTQLKQEIEVSIATLMSTINIWKGQSVISSPIDGYVEILPNISDGQIVIANMPILRVLPYENGIKGEMTFQIKDVGTLTGNEQVEIVLDSYPQKQYGYIIGTIDKLSASIYNNSDNESIRTADIKIDMDNQPYFWGNISFVHGMTGTAHIIIKERSLMEQIFNFIIINFRK